MKKIIIFTSSRADYGILKNLIFDLKKKKIIIQVYAGGAHFKKNKNQSSTDQEILNDKLKIDFRGTNVLQNT